MGIDLDLDDAANALAELGNPVRLAAFRLLVRAGRTGRSVGSLAAELDVPNSTFTHHVAHLVRAGLVRQERDGRTLMCIADFQRMANLISYLQEECCVDEIVARETNAKGTPVRVRSMRNRRGRTNKSKSA